MLFVCNWADKLSNTDTRWFLQKDNKCVMIFTGWLQSMYGIYTFRVESIAHGKAAPVDELQVQGVANPALLRKVMELIFMLLSFFSF